MKLRRLNRSFQISAGFISIIENSYMLLRLSRNLSQLKQADISTTESFTGESE